MIYKAFLNGKEVSDFPINGIDTDEVYGGNTLLWQKYRGFDTPVKYAIRFIFKKGIYQSVYDEELGDYKKLLVTDEAGYYLFISTSNPFVPEKIAYCIKKYKETTHNVDTYYYGVAVGMKSTNSTSMAMPYASHEGKLNKFTFGGSFVLKKDSDGIYSWGGTYEFYELIYPTSIVDADGHTVVGLEVDNVRNITTTDGAKIFYDLEKMKAWLKAD